jgi:hypothetical protein
VTIVLFYTLVVVLGVLSMGYQLLASRLLSPYFGSSIIVWAWLISTFLAAFSVGSMFGGWVSKLASRSRFRTQVVSAAVGVGFFAVTAVAGRPILELIFDHVESMNTGLFFACVGLFFVPVTVLSSFGPQNVQYLANRGIAPGAASGIVYGVSTVGNIAGVMLTAFAMIPHVRVSILFYVWLGVALVGLASLIGILRAPPPPAA